MINDSRPYTFDRVIRLLIGAGCLLAVFWLLNRLSDALLPFFVACLPTSLSRLWLLTSAYSDFAAISYPSCCFSLSYVA